jgi:hypothetical protein
VCLRISTWLSYPNVLHNRALEIDIHKTCGDLVDSYVVIGHGRPKPCLVVESSVVVGSRVELISDLLKRLEPVMKTRYVHEHIRDASQVIAIDPGSLPRTPKGNIRCVFTRHLDLSG